MVLFFKKTKELSKKIVVVENNLKQSFGKVRADTDYLRAWLNYYFQRGLYLENQIRFLYRKSEELNSNLDDSNSALVTHTNMMGEITENLDLLQKNLSLVKDSMQKFLPTERFNFHIENISTDMHDMHKKIEQIYYLPAKIESLKEEINSHVSTPHLSSSVNKRIDDLQERLNQIIIKKTPKEKLVQKVKKNRHDYIKAVVLSYIKKYEKISGFQLREMIVEEQNMTSKSTFYRILEEIEDMDDISIIRQGKEKVYLAKLTKPA